MGEKDGWILRSLSLKLLNPSWYNGWNSTLTMVRLWSGVSDSHCSRNAGSNPGILKSTNRNSSAICPYLQFLATVRFGVSPCDEMF